MFLIELKKNKKNYLSTPQPTDTTEGAPTSEAAEPKLVIWGTDVVVSETKEKFKSFLTEFTIDELDEMNDDFDPTQPLYMQKIEEVAILWLEC